MKKVLHLRASGGILGAENVIKEIAIKSRLFGYESIVGIIYDTDDTYPEYVDFLKNYKIETVVFKGNGKIDTKRIKEIRKYVNDNKIDLLHSHGYKEDYNSLLTKQDMPKIATNHLWKRTNLKSKLYTLVDALFLQFFNIVTGVSSEIMKDMKKYYLRRIIKVPNGIDTDFYSPMLKNKDINLKIGIPMDSVIIGMISSITKVKGHEIAIKAFKCVKNTNSNAYLLIVGEGKMSDQLKHMVECEGLADNVKFAGKTQRVREYLSIIDIFLITSFREGLPMALLEAMAMGKPVIATRVGEIPQIVRDGKNGFLINAGDQNELVRKINNIAKNKYARETIGIAARNSILKKYSSEKMTKNYCRLYDILTK